MSQNTKNVVTVLTDNKIQLFITLASVAVVLIGAFITIRLVPLYQSQSELVGRVNALEKQEEKNVEMETFNQLVNRIDHISSRVDSIYSIIVKK